VNAGGLIKNFLVISLYWCIILTIDFGKSNSTFHLLSKKCPKSDLETTFIKKKLLLPLLSASKIFVRSLILEKKMFLDKKAKGNGIWFPYEKR